MKKMINIAALVLMVALLALMGSCVWSEADDDCGEDCCTDCAPPPPPPPPPVQVWEQLGPDTTLAVSGVCGGCGFDEDVSYDTIELTSWDDAIADLQFNFRLDNYSDQSASVSVTLCDYLGCEDVISIALFPYETYYDMVPNPVLDTLLDEYYDCLYTWGDACVLDYDVDVYLDQQCSCEPVSMTYSYEGLYVY